ncbi:sugar phosphate nucleotidyltransferase [Halorubellus sp. PRR65]|uniref:mannose-1-phosphate guanylyltransferase n=1 Tax=Halorubellus sp. PRR65 TaxID=3098148 RepID=UPI002B25EAFF|nr:sugar phosphate nucleotidyltransferase [Halorubellus sp. PRR65]
MVTTVACVLAGGTGTRLYPASRRDRPKQFLALDGERSLLRETVDRVAFADETVVLTGSEHADAVREHAPDAAVFVEPEAKDTGPALAYAARRAREAFGECALLCVPADHHVDGEFAAVARHATAVAVETDGLVTMGVEPTRPATGYGYVEPGEFRERAGGEYAAADAPDEPAGGEYAPVAAFREKPDRETAEQLVDLGCLWNAGVFAWTPTAFLRECEGTPLEPLADDALDLESAFDAAPAVSVDYAVLERTDDAYVVPADFAWDDLGSWDAIARILDTDDAGNAVLATGSDGDAGGPASAPTLVDTTNSVVATDDTHVAVVDCEGVVVAAFDDRVLVLPRESSQRVRDVVSDLRDRDLF